MFKDIFISFALAIKHFSDNVFPFEKRSTILFNEFKIQLGVRQIVKNKMFPQAVNQERHFLWSFGLWNQMESFKNFCFLLLVFWNGNFFGCESFIELFSKMGLGRHFKTKGKKVTASFEGSIFQSPIS